MINFIVTFNKDYIVPTQTANTVLFELFGEHVIALGQDYSRENQSERFLVKAEFLPTQGDKGHQLKMNLGRVANLIAYKFDELRLEKHLARAIAEEDEPLRIPVC